MINWSGAFCDQDLKDIGIERGGFRGELEVLKGRRGGDRSKHPHCVIILAWPQLVASSPKARAFKCESHERRFCNPDPVLLLGKTAVQVVSLRTEWPMSVCPELSCLFSLKVPHWLVALGSWEIRCRLVGRTLQAVVLSWTQYYYPGQVKGGAMEANLKSMVHMGNLLFSHFNLGSRIPWFRERSTKLLLLRF